MKRINWKLLLLLILALILQPLVPPLYPDSCKAVWPAIIGGIATLGSAILGGFSNKSSNKSNMKTNQMNNEFNAREAEKARAFQLDMWNKENAYNTASAQRDRLSEAGLNPYLMMNGGSAGVAGTTGATSQAQAASPIQVNPMDYSSLGAGIARAAEMAYQEEQSNASTEAMQSQKAYYQALTNQVFSEIDWGKLTPEYKNWMRTTGALRAQLSYNTDKQTLQNLEWTNKIQRAQRTQLMLSNNSQRILNKYLDQQQQIQLNVMASQYYDMMAAGHLKYKQCQEIIAKMILYKKQGHFFESQANLAEKQGALVDSQTRMQDLTWNQAMQLSDDYIQAMMSAYGDQSDYWSGYDAYEAGKGDSQTKKYQGKQQKWNYQKRWFDAGLQTVGTVGNAVGSVAPFMSGPKRITGFGR